MDKMQADSQLKLLIRTSKAKLEFKLGKSRALSSHTIQTTIVPDLRNLAAIPNDTRPFERGLDILKMKLAQMVRNDRTADVWEDLIGELAVLENSLHQLVSMMEEQRELAAQKQTEDRKRRAKPSGNNSQGWSFLGFTVGQNSLGSAGGEEPGIEKSKSDDKDEIDEVKIMNRVTKVVRNVVVAQDYLSDDIKELHKLTSALSKCIDKPDVLAHSPDTTDKAATDETIDLEDRVYIEIVRKLRGDDEETVVTDYMHELCDIYKIDIYNENKYKDASTGDDEDNEEDGGGKTETQPLKPQVKKKLDDLDDLKQRFEALRKS